VIKLVISVTWLVKLARLVSKYPEFSIKFVCWSLLASLLKFLHTLFGNSAAAVQFVSFINSTDQITCTKLIKGLYIPTYLPAYIPTCLPTYLLAYLPNLLAYKPTCLPTYLTCMPTYLLAYLPTYLYLSMFMLLPLRAKGICETLRFTSDS
jgi:hypothetical protein